MISTAVRKVAISGIEQRDPPSGRRMAFGGSSGNAAAIADWL